MLEDREERRVERGFIVVSFLLPLVVDSPTVPEVFACFQRSKGVLAACVCSVPEGFSPICTSQHELPSLENSPS